ncbi:MAG: archaea-specific SMC-related protein [Euryarchaeota archaeon]|nr:archaea-specific SMC-related protein [Euryarchaeota archaeon]
MKLELQNIGGFAGVHRFELKKGINCITAPNAKGKSSLLRGIQCLASDDEGLFRDVLNDDSDSGYVKLGDEYVRHLMRVNGVVHAYPSEDHIFFDENSEWGNVEKIAFFTPGRGFDVLRFVNSISGAEEIESGIRRKEGPLEEKKRELEEYIENLTTAQKLDAEIGTMHGEIQKLQGEVQKLRGEIEKETETRDLTKVGEDIAAKKQEILDLEERLRSREGEVKRYQDQYEKARALYDRLDEDIADFEQKSESESVEEFTGELHKHERERKNLKIVKDMLDDLQGVVDKAYKVFSDSGRVPLPCIKDDPLLHKASILLGEPGECPVCRGGAVRNMLDDRCKELKECATDFAKEIRGEEEEMKVIKADIRELTDRIDGIDMKRRERDKAKRNSNDLLKELDDRKNLRDGVDEEIAEKVHELGILEQQYADAAKTVRTESRDQLNKVREKIRGYENEIRNNQNEMDRLTREIPDYTIGESLEDYANKKRLGLDDLRLKIEGLKDEWEHEVFGAVDLFNKNINDIYKEMGFTTFRDIKITKEILRGRLTSLDAVVEHASGKKQSLSSLSETERLTICLIFQISAKENYIPAFPFFVIDDNMRTYDPEQYYSITRYLEGITDYVLTSQLVPRSEQGDLSIEYGFN